MKKIFSLLTVLFFLVSCTPTDPLPQPRRVVDPTGIPGAVHTPNWDIAAISYEYSGQGIDYRKSGLEPVFLVFRNKSRLTPRILIDDIHGKGRKDTFLPYSTAEAERLVFASEHFKLNAKNALKSGTLGAVIGAGLGAILGSITGGDAIASGAALGAGIGGISMGVASVPEAQRKLKRIIGQDLEQHAWKEGAIGPEMTRMGYVYFPAEQGIDGLSLSVRTDSGVQTYNVPVLDSLKDKSD